LRIFPAIFLQLLTFSLQKSILFLQKSAAFFPLLYREKPFSAPYAAVLKRRFFDSNQQTKSIKGRQYEAQ